MFCILGAKPIIVFFFGEFLVAFKKNLPLCHSWTWLRNDREKERGGLDLCFGFGAARPAWLPRNLSQSGGHKIYTVGRGIGAEAGANEP